MTKDDIVRIAREAGVFIEAGLAPVFYDHAQLYRFSELVAQREREKCAQNYPTWQPISTAPKNGDEILLCCGNGDMGVAYWRDDRCMTGWTCGWDTTFFNPDRWMPLPPINNQITTGHSNHD